MSNTKSEIPLFGVDNTTDCEQYLFLNHPTTFISLTSDIKEEHHPIPSPPKSILKPTSPHNVTFAPTPAAAAAAPAPMERKSSTTSTVSSASSDEGFLGGGALRHLSGSHCPHHHRGNAQHLQELAELAALDQQAKARRSSNVQRGAEEKEKQQQDWLSSVLAWWPEQVEGMEHEWTEEFYE